MTTLIQWASSIAREMLFQGGYVATPRTLGASSDDVSRRVDPTPARSRHASDRGMQAESAALPSPSTRTAA